MTKLDGVTTPSRVAASGVAVAVLANLLGGTSYVLTKIALGGLTETTLIVVRTVVALAVLVPLAGPGLAPLLRAPGRERRRLVVMGAAGYALPLVLASYGLRHSTATNAALLIAGRATRHRARRPAGPGPSDSGGYGRWRSSSGRPARPSSPRTASRS